MPKTAKISISLPDDVLARVDRERRESGESRSELFRRALRTLFRLQRREAAVREYVEGYVADPETPHEIAAAESAARSAWGDEEDWT